MLMLVPDPVPVFQSLWVDNNVGFQSLWVDNNAGGQSDDEVWRAKGACQEEDPPCVHWLECLMLASDDEQRTGSDSVRSP